MWAWSRRPRALSTQQLQSHVSTPRVIYLYPNSLELVRGLSAVCGASLRSLHIAHAQQLTQVQEVSESTTTSSSSAQPQAAASKAQPAVQGEDDARDWEAEMEELMKLVALLPQSVRSVVESHPQMPELLEVVMDLGRPPLARFPDGDVRLSENPITQADLDYAVSQVGEFGGDNRAGINRTLHRISCIRNRAGRIIGLTCRVGRAIKGSAKMVADIVMSGASILLLGRPGVGKTTAIREVSRTLGDDLSKRVVIVDTSNEIGGDGDIPHPGIGRARRMQVPNPEEQHRVMIEAVENHMPEVVVIDEIGTLEECGAARTIAQRGVQLVATAHGNELENVIKNPSLADLVGGIQSVTLGDEEARKRGVQKSILERAGPPTFDVAIEMLERGKWRVHLDVAQAVDLLLSGMQPGGQVRERAPDGAVLKYNYNPAVSDTLTTAARDFGPSSSGASNGKGSGASNGGSTSAKAARAAAAAALSAAEGAAAAAPRTQLPRGPAGESAEADALAGLKQQQQSQAQGGSRGGSFHKRSLDAILDGEDEDEADKQDSSSDGVSPQKGARRLANRQALIGVDPRTAVLRLFPYELDADKLWEVLVAMELQEKVLIVKRVSDADAVLGLRAKVKSDAALRQAAKVARVPIYAIKAVGTSTLVRALRTLLGIDPSAGGMFVRSASGSSEGRSVEQGGSESDGSESDVPGSSSTSSSRGIVEALDDAAGTPAVSGSLRAEMDIEAVGRTQKGSEASGASSRPTSYRVLEEALEEARMAAEQIVGPLGQPVELLPRSETIIAEQVKLLNRYALGHEVVGTAAEARIRILPAPAAAVADA